MRLSSIQVSAIKQAAAQAFGADVVVRLFGSRTDDARRGGDIDLHIESHARGTALQWIDRAALREGIIL